VAVIVREDPSTRHARKPARAAEERRGGRGDGQSKGGAGSDGYRKWGRQVGCRASGDGDADAPYSWGGELVFSSGVAAADEDEEEDTTGNCDDDEGMEKLGSNSRKKSSDSSSYGGTADGQSTSLLPKRRRRQRGEGGPPGRAPNSGTSSKFKGVHWNQQYGKWAARICFARKRTHLGYFDLEEDAARKYEAAARSLGGMPRFRKNGVKTKTSTSHGGVPGDADHVSGRCGSAADAAADNGQPSRASNPRVTYYGDCIQGDENFLSGRSVVW